MFLGCEAKVGKFDGSAIVHNKDVLRLEIPVVDSARVTVLDSRQDLQKYIPGLHVVADILALLGDLGKEISFRAVLKDNICAVRALQGLVKGHNIGMLALVVKLDLAILESPLTFVKANLGQGLYSILNVGQEVPSPVDSAICTNTENIGQLNTIVQNQVDPVMRVA
jgi:hypothetical protein